MKSSLRVYLCGSIRKGADDKRSSFWSQHDIDELRKTAAPTDLVILNPGDRSDDLGDVRATFGRDLLQVFTSDVVIVDARAKRGVGVGAELLFAKTNKIPVVTVVPPDSHYSRSNVVLMGQFVERWTHPFVAELSDVLVDSVAQAAEIVASSEFPGRVRGPECIYDAMLHYLSTQEDREPDMVSLLVAADGIPTRAGDLLGRFRS